jgi:hypothetical protein
MKAEVTIALGGQSYKIRRLTLGQQRALGIGVAKGNEAKRQSDETAKMLAGAELIAARAKAEGESYDYFVEIVAAALSRDHPTMTAEAIYAVESDLDEICAAARKILAFTGYVPVGETRAAAASTGDGSTAT